MDEQGSVNVLGFRIPVLVAITSLVGAVALVLSYIAGLFPGRDKDANSNKVTSNEGGDRNFVNVDSSSSSQNPGTTTSVNANGNTTSGKRAKNKKRREAQQEFAHPWMVGALKGHTAPVLDINFSSNGKFLASCAEDCDLVPEGEPELGDASSSSGEGNYVLEGKSSQGNTAESRSSSPPTASIVTTNIENCDNKSNNNNNNNESLSSSSSPSVKQLEKVRSSLSSSSSSSSLSQGTNEDTIKVTVDRTSLSRRQRKNRTRAPREQRRIRDRDEDPDDLLTATKPRHRHHHRIHHQPDVKLRHRRNESPVRPDTSSECNPAKSRSLKSSKKNRTSKENSEAATMNGNYYWSPMYPSFISMPYVEYVNPRAHVITGTHASNSFACLNTDNNHHHQSMMNRLNHFSESAIVSFMKRYILSESACKSHGYPIQCDQTPNCVFVEHSQHRPTTAQQNERWHRRLDVNAREFVPSSIALTNTERVWSATPAECEVDSGTGTSSSVENSDQEPEFSSDSDKNSDVGESFSPSLSSSSSSSSSSASLCSSEFSSRESITKLEYAEIGGPRRSLDNAKNECSRCGKIYTVNYNTGKYTREEECVYHWGKILNSRIPGVKPRIWECCQRTENVGGCTTASKHVTTGLSPGSNGPYHDYVRTSPSRVFAADGNYGVYAIDCEMCYTIWGLELTRVTVVNMTGRVIYDNYVRPYAQIIDYNTRFSGITAETLSGATKSLADVQRDLMGFIHAESILVGHGLGNDLRVLKLIHGNVIDTTVIYPHPRGLPLRKSLKTLARTVLRRHIQIAEHDSVEDARTAMDIVLAKIHSDIN